MADAAAPTSAPAAPPAIPSIPDSSTNCVRMFRRDAPSARLKPISRVRSRTDMSITVRMPMAPSIRAMPDTTGTS